MFEPSILALLQLNEPGSGKRGLSSACDVYHSPQSSSSPLSPPPLPRRRDYSFRLSLPLVIAPNLTPHQGMKTGVRANECLIISSSPTSIESTRASSARCPSPIVGRMFFFIVFLMKWVRKHAGKGFWETAGKLSGSCVASDVTRVAAAKSSLDVCCFQYQHNCEVAMKALFDVVEGVFSFFVEA